MSSWGFLSKAEGFLDRVLDEQSRDSNKIKRPSSSSIPGDSKGESVGATVPGPVVSWQDRLSRAASQFASTESLVSAKVSFERPRETHDVAPEQAVREASRDSSIDVPENIQENQPLTTLHSNAPLTELQMSNVFPPTMPSHITRAGKVQESHPVNLQVGQPEKTELEAVDHHLKSLEDSVDVQSEVQSNSTGTAEVSGIASLPEPGSDPQAEDSAVVTRLRNDLQICEARRTEEAQISAERISALERKLAYFSDESLSQNREISRVAGADVQIRLLAEKDTRIALLLEEGENLSKKELQHLSALKKLRTRVSELESLIGTSLKAVEKADAEGGAIKREMRLVQDALKRSEAKVKELAKYEAEVQSLRTDKQAQTKAINELKRQLMDADDTISQNVTIWTQLQAEKSKTDSLQGRIVSLLMDAKVAAEESASDMADLQGKFDRFMERSKASEAEKLSDISRLEVENENLRARLEESTTNASESSQAKLLRQIESLQTQQSLARQNWARIEESLVMRSAHAERERDELREQETDLRQRLRQLAQAKKDAEEERAQLRSKVRSLEGSAHDRVEELELLQKQLGDTKRLWDDERQSWVIERESFAANLEGRIQERLLEEQRVGVVGLPETPYMQDAANRSGFPFQRHIPDSPNMSLTPDKRPSMSSRHPTQYSRAPHNRRTSQFSTLEDLKSPPTIGREEDPFDPDDAYGQLKQHTEASMSTVSASASMGMMERVSANIRKLELELGILREDLSRMTRQRDEARNSCVEMDSIERDRARLQDAVKKMEAESAKLQVKFETTLELLGEQTEENEQLREDIADMQKAFKESLASMGMGSG